MKPLGICLETPEEKLLDDLARGFFKAAYLDKSPEERALIDSWMDSEDTSKTAGFWSGTGRVLGSLGKGMFVDPLVNGAGNLREYMLASRRGDYGIARRQLAGAALNGGSFALNFFPGGGLVGGLGRGAMAGAGMLTNLGRAAWATRLGIKGLGAAGALANVGARVGAQGGLQAGVGALSTGVNLAQGAAAAAPTAVKALSGGARFLHAVKPWAQNAGIFGVFTGGRLLGPDQALTTGAAEVGASNPNDPNSVVNTSAFGLPRGTTTGLPNVGGS